MSSLSWAKRFGVSDREVADLQNHLNETGEDALRWVLINEHVDQREYLQWAMESYELPVVTNNFFKIPPDLPFWEAVKTGFTWTPGFVPLAEWQGVLFIGCLEPPRFHFPLRSAHRFVLAPAELLEQRFYDYQPGVSRPDHSANESENSSETPAQVVAQVAAQAEVRQRPMDEFLADSLPEAPDVSLENPDGLVHEVAPASTPNLFVVPDGLPTDDIGQPLSSLPDGIADGTAVFDFSTADETTPEQQRPTASQAAPVATPAKVAAPFAPAAPTFAPKPQAPVELASRPYTDESDATVATAAQMPPSIPTHAPKVVPLTPPPAPSVAAQMAAKGMIVPMSVTAVPLETCTSYDSLGAAAIGHILKNFDQGVVLLFQAGELRPWKWTEQLLSVKGDSPDAIPLEKPSIFRVAYRTCLPYHGYVVENPVNTAFFNAFTRGIMPKHVTIIPVLINGELVGMLMGLASEKVDYKASLIAMEKLASEFGTNLDRMRGRQAA